MPNEKLEYYVKMAEDTARKITWNQANWTAFLRMASRLYKYPFQEQLLIFAQRPSASALWQTEGLTRFPPLLMFFSRKLTTLF